MNHADAFSRNPVEESEPMRFDKINMLQINTCEDDWVLAAQLQDERIKYLYKILSNKPSHNQKTNIHTKYKLVNGRVYKETEDGLKWVVPKAAKRHLVTVYDDMNGHFAADETFKASAQHYWFPSMGQYI